MAICVIQLLGQEVQTGTFTHYDLDPKPYPDLDIDSDIVTGVLCVVGGYCDASNVVRAVARSDKDNIDSQSSVQRDVHSTLHHS
jgi:hypothetical protein